MNYTQAEIEQRRAAGIRMNREGCGWRLPVEITARIAQRIAAFTPTTDRERRDKRILELAFIQNMNPHSIARLGDPHIVCLGNNNRGQPMTARGISSICMAFAPEIAAYRRQKRAQQTPEREQRNALNRQRSAGEIHRQTRCAICSSEEDIAQHHIIPIAAGGTNDYFNLVTMCHTCHMKLHHQLYNRLQWLRAGDQSGGRIRPAQGRTRKGGGSSMNYALFYDMIQAEIPAVQDEYLATGDYRQCKILAALYELQDYAAGKLAKLGLADEETTGAGNS